MNTLNILLQAAPAGEQSPMGNMILLVGIMVVFFFFMVRPQMKRQKEARKFREGLQKGDSVVTLGGIYGKIDEIKEDNIVILEIAKDVKIKIDKTALQQSMDAVNQANK